MSTRVTVTLAAVLGLAIVNCPRAGAQSDPMPLGAPAVKEVEALQEAIRAQPELMEAINALRSDPEFQKVLNDPEIGAALQSGNLEALLANPKINGLVDNPEVQVITKKLTQ